MHVPVSLRIGAQHYTVHLDERLAHGEKFGETNLATLEITIDATSQPGRQRQTLVHEIVEALNHELHIGLRHQQIELLEAGLYQVIKDNPSLFVKTEE